MVMKKREVELKAEIARMLAVAEEERRIEAEKEKQRQAEGRKKPGKAAAPPAQTRFVLDND